MRDGISIQGVKKETVKEARNAILSILATKQPPEVLIEALKTLHTICFVGQVSMSNISITGEVVKPKKKAA